MSELRLRLKGAPQGLAVWTSELPVQLRSDQSPAPRQFPKDQFPSYGWTQRPSGFPNEVWTTETTHRDGQQGGLPLTTEQSLRIYDLICRFTGRSGAIRQAEFFIYRKQDLDAFRAVQERYATGSPIEPTTWIRAAAKDVRLIQSLGVTESGLLASISDYHVFHKFKPGGAHRLRTSIWMPYSWLSMRGSAPDSIWKTLPGFSEFSGFSGARRRKKNYSLD